MQNTLFWAIGSMLVVLFIVLAIVFAIFFVRREQFYYAVGTMAFGLIISCIASFFIAGVI